MHNMIFEVKLKNGNTMKNLRYAVNAPRIVSEHRFIVFEDFITETETSDMHTNLIPVFQYINFEAIERITVKEDVES